MESNRLYIGACQPYQNASQQPVTFQQMMEAAVRLNPHHFQFYPGSSTASQHLAAAVLAVPSHFQHQCVGYGGGIVHPAIAYREGYYGVQQHLAASSTAMFDGELSRQHPTQLRPAAAARSEHAQTFSVDGLLSTGDGGLAPVKIERFASMESNSATVASVSSSVSTRCGKRLHKSEEHCSVLIDELFLQ